VVARAGWYHGNVCLSMLDIVTVDSVLDAFCATVKGDSCTDGRSELASSLYSSQYDTSGPMSIDFPFSALSHDQLQHPRKTQTHLARRIRLGACSHARPKRPS
jgi:hypothetical protein